ncbi:MAG: signal peptidase I [Promethearchaeota archaeon]|nr:MAG: signal peptidase I [Candidatus Lokiarchaeota archaeon]
MIRKNLKKKISREDKEPIPKKKIAIAIFLITFAFFGSYLIYFILQIAFNTPTPLVVVVSESMEPTYNKGDILFVQGKDPEDIKVGDVIVYDAEGLWEGAPEDPIVHRVIDKYEEDGKIYFETRGDANNLKDEEPVPQNRVLGVVVGHIPYLGWVKIILTDLGLLIPVIIILSVPLVVSILWDLFKEEAEEEREKSIKQESTKPIQLPRKKFIPKIEQEEQEEDDFDF